MASHSRRSPDLSFSVRRIHGLLGLLPIGGFVVYHIVAHTSVFVSTSAFDERFESAWPRPITLCVEVLALWLPLLVHAGVGVSIALRDRSPLPILATRANVLYVSQRATGLFLLVFLIVHLLQFRAYGVLPAATGTGTFRSVARTLASPATCTLYWFAALAVSFHLANGLRLFCLSWGLISGRCAQRRLGHVSLAFGLALFTTLALLLAFGFSDGRLG